jgi:predicted ATP-dependent serine protease
MLSHNLGGNKNKKNTTFLAIQQVTKGGVFVGSNKLKHNTTGMLELRRGDEDINPHMVFTKNRRGQVQEKLFYSLSNSGDVDYQRTTIEFGTDGNEVVEVKMDPLDLQEFEEVINKLRI